jgi:hypothetical protein
MACDGLVWVSERRSIISSQSNEPITSRREDKAVSAVVPPFIQQVVEHRAGPLAYVPTRAPFGYRYLSYTWDAGAHRLTVRLHDKHYAATNPNRTVAVTAQWFSAPAAQCGTGNEKSYQVDGNRIFSSGADLAWRCVRASNGRLVKIVAAGKNLPASTLAIVASSVKRI